MLKIRLQGTTNDIKWFKKILERDKRITVLDISETYEALLSFYNDYINKVLFSGSYFKVIDISAEDRFEEHSCNSEITSIE